MAPALMMIAFVEFAALAGLLLDPADLPVRFLAILGPAAGIGFLVWIPAFAPLGLEGNLAGGGGSHPVQAGGMKSAWAALPVSLSDVRRGARRSLLVTVLGSVLLIAALLAGMHHFLGDYQHVPGAVYGLVGAWAVLGVFAMAPVPSALLLGDRVDRLLSAANCALLVLFVLWRPVWESVLEGTGEGWWVYAIGAGTTATLWYCLGR